MCGRDARWEIRRGEDGWPSALEELSPPPDRVFGCGDPAALLAPALAVVGARRATPYGLSVAAMAGRVAAECGVAVVSGGAMGCDHAAGSAALAAGGVGVVVSGCGADVVYPESSRDVFEGTVASGGAVISLERWGAPPRRWAFPKRNAVIAALAEVLVVTEAGPRSGTMSTADVAVELGRVIYAIPGSIFSPESAGTNRLIAEGARVIPDEQSLETAISLDFGVARLGVRRSRREGGPIMSALLASPTRPDELATRMGVDVLTIMRTLTEYEARGMAQRLPDGRYSPTEAYLLGHN